MNTVLQSPALSRSTSQKVVFTIDVEDWFHILEVSGTPSLDTWNSLPSRVEQNFSRLLEILKAHGVQATCFFLGWVAERFPHLVRRAVEEGHEIASHGYSHRVVYKMERSEFVEELRHARELLEQISGTAVLGYRAPGFSAVRETPWFFESVQEAGYKYDSSVFPAKRVHGSLEIDELGPHKIAGLDLIEIPISIADFLGRRICFFGGGYLRFFPLWLVDRKVREVLGEGRPVIVYVHPREIDPGHTRVAMSASRRFRSYTRLHTMEPKLHHLMSRYSSETMSSMIQRQWPEFGLETAVRSALK